MYAILQALSACLPPVTIVTDYKGVIDGLDKGRAWCTAPRRTNVDLWENLGDKADDLGGSL
eukprot:8854197-Pyramimonas_sp.AAC.1